MSQKSVRLLISDTIAALTDNIKFFFATPADFNSIEDKKDPLARLELLKYKASFTSGRQTLLKIYPIEITFYQHDDPNAAEEATMNVLDTVDKYVDEFIRRLNVFDMPLVNSLSPNIIDPPISSGNIVISEISVQPFKKQTSDCLTGYVLTFNLEVPDDFDYCSIY